MMNAFLVRSGCEEEVIPGKIKICNSTGKGAWFAVYEDRGSLLIILATAEGASEISAMEEPERHANDIVD